MRPYDTIDTSVLNVMNAGLDAKTKNSGDELRENFLTLLITQIQNQDPLEPMKNTELTSHLAQINTVTGINALNSTLDGIANQLETSQTMQAAALIGSAVLVPGDRVLVGEDGASTPFGLELERGAEQVKAVIMDGSGQVVHTVNLGPIKKGVETFYWDGRMDNGETAPKGSYRVSIEALDKDGKGVTGATLSYALVQGVSPGDGGGMRLDLGGVAEPVRMEDVRKIL